MHGDLLVSITQKGKEEENQEIFQRTDGKIARLIGSSEATIQHTNPSTAPVCGLD
jgi:hypothetical protein